MSFAQIDPNLLAGQNGDTCTDFDAVDYTRGVVNCQKGATIVVNANPDDSNFDQVGVCSDTSCREQGLVRCGIRPIDLSICSTC
jgi:hypothetical protein